MTISKLANKVYDNERAISDIESRMTVIDCIIAEMLEKRENTAKRQSKQSKQSPRRKRWEQEVNGKEHSKPVYVTEDPAGDLDPYAQCSLTPDDFIKIMLDESESDIVRVAEDTSYADYEAEYEAGWN